MDNKAILKAHNLLSQETSKQSPFLKDTLSHFAGTKSGGMNWYAFNEPDPTIPNDPVRGGEYWARFIETAPDYYLVEDEINIIQEHAQEIGRYLPAHAYSVDLGPGNKSAIMGKTVPFNKALHHPVGFTAVDVNNKFASDAAKYVETEINIETDHIVGDFLNTHLNISPVTPTIFSLFGGLLCNAPRDPKINALDQLSETFRKLGRNMTYGDYLVITQDTNQNENSLLKAYNHPDMGRYILSILHKIARDLPCENFHAEMFDFVPRWNKKESLLSLNAKLNPDFGMPSFKIGGVPFTLKRGQEIPLVNSYKFTCAQFIGAARQAGFICEKTYESDSIKNALHILRYYGAGKLV